MNIYKQHAYNRSVGWSTWHLQWCTKYRYKIFSSPERRNLCKIFLHEAAKRHNFAILDSEVDVDHIHVLASLPLTMTPSDAMQKLKGFTARCLFIEMPLLEGLYKKRHLWSPGKFMGSVGHITLETAKKYIEAHHAKFCFSSRESQTFKSGRMSINFRLRIYKLIVAQFFHANLNNSPKFISKQTTGMTICQLVMTCGCNSPIKAIFFPLIVTSPLLPGMNGGCSDSLTAHSNPNALINASKTCLISVKSVLSWHNMTQRCSGSRMPVSVSQGTKILPISKMFCGYS